MRKYLSFFLLLAFIFTFKAKPVYAAASYPVSDYNSLKNALDEISKINPPEGATITFGETITIPHGATLTGSDLNCKIIYTGSSPSIFELEGSANLTGINIELDDTASVKSIISSNFTAGSEDFKVIISSCNFNNRENVTSINIKAEKEVTLEVSNCTFENGSGAVSLSSDGSFIFTNNTVSDYSNTAVTTSGAIISTVTGNTIEPSDGAKGISIGCASGSAVNGNTFKGNFSGPQLQVVGGSVDISNNIFSAPPAPYDTPPPEPIPLNEKNIPVIYLKESALDGFSENTFTVEKEKNDRISGYGLTLLESTDELMYDGDDSSNNKFIYSPPLVGNVDYSEGISADEHKIYLTGVTITFDGNGSDKEPDPEESKLYYSEKGEKIILPSVTKAGHEFLYWADENGERFDFSQEITKSMTLKAKWKVIATPTPPTTPTAPPTSTPSTDSSDSSDDTPTSSQPTSSPSATVTSPPMEKPVILEPERIPQAPIPMYSRAYVVGYPDSIFGPSLDVTRAEVALMLYNLTDDDYKEDFAATGKVFSDVKSDEWYSQAVEYLYDRLIISGYPDGSFAPDKSITRAEMIVLICRVKALNLEADYVFSDVEADMWYAKSIANGYQDGFLQGYPDGSFKPENPIIRSETVIVMNRAFNINDINKTVYYLDDLPLWAEDDIIAATIEDWQYRIYLAYIQSLED